MDLVQGVITLLLFLLILGVLVIVHEFGHFVVARLARVRVLEFGIGFPPRARVLRDQGETVYTLNWLPIGGFVKLEGEDGGDADDPRSFSAKPLITRLLILVAGVVMNLALAFAIFAGIALSGDPTIGIVAGVVEADSPAARAGLVAGDVIESVDGRYFSAFGPTSLLEELRAKAGQTVVLGVRRSDGTFERLTATLRPRAEVSANRGALGIGQLTGRTTDTKLTHRPDAAIQLGVDRTLGATRLIVDGIGELATAIVSRPTEPPPAAGPVGIAIQIGDVFWQLGPIVTLFLAGVLSANLAVINILPLPPLDGGRMLVLVLKSLFGSRLSLRVERLTYVVGFAFLFGFLIWVTGFDVLRSLGLVQ
ncbi:MAG: RIP metalloprotease [Chloroflexi bacterium]|nr:RIP metalloprotease [Chloroflexota bacterium]